MPPVIAELPVVKLADVRLGPNPVPGDGRGDGVEDDQGDAPGKGPPMAVLNINRARGGEVRAKGVPGVKKPSNYWLNLRAVEEGVGDVLRGVCCVAGWGGAVGERERERRCQNWERKALQPIWP